MRRKKKYLLLAFCLLLGFSVLGIQASAKDLEPEIKYIKVTKKNVRPGEKVKFRIKLANDKKAKSVGQICQWRFCVLHYSYRWNVGKPGFEI